MKKTLIIEELIAEN